MSMLASQAAVSFESAQGFSRRCVRPICGWSGGKQIGRMGSYRWNTRTLLSRASRECYRIFDIDLGINPVPFEVFKSRVHPDDLPALELALTEAVSTKSPFSHEYRVVHRDGTTLHVIAVGQFDLGPSGDVELEGIITDITERKAAEQALTDARNELARAVRLASLGELAGSIVHEINQPLTGIIMSAEACLRWLARDPARAWRSPQVRGARYRTGDAGRATSSRASDHWRATRNSDFTERSRSTRPSRRFFFCRRGTRSRRSHAQVDFDRSMPSIEGGPGPASAGRLQPRAQCHRRHGRALREGPRILTASFKGCGRSYLRNDRGYRRRHRLREQGAPLRCALHDER